MPMVANFFPVTGARLALDRYAFNNHVDGYNARHIASTIDLSPAVPINLVSYTDVQSILAAISAQLDIIANNGLGFIAIPDGYDTYINSLATPNNPYDGAVPALNSVLDDLLNNPANPLYFRIRSGGVVLIPAGTYKFTDTVNVPPGITILGEGFGTRICNQTSPPKPLFKFKADLSRVPDIGVDSVSTFMFAKQSGLLNLTIADNFVEPKFLGDTGYLTPTNNDSINPLVSVEEGAHLYCQNVRFLGKTVYTLGVISDLTSFAVAVDSTIPISSGTIIRMYDCFLDGFAVAVSHQGLNGSFDSVDIKNNFIRVHGFLNSDLVAANNNCVFRLNSCNINISHNTVVGNTAGVTSLLYINDQEAAATPLQSYSRISVSNNNVYIEKSSVASNSTFSFLSRNASLSGAEKFTSLSAANNFQNEVNWTVALGDTLQPQLEITPTSISLYNAAGNINFNSSNIGLDGTIFDLLVPAWFQSQISLKPTLITFADSPYSVTAADNLILVDTSGGAITINLPNMATSYGSRKLIIKDITGNSDTNPITFGRFDPGDYIEGLVADYVFSSAYGSINFISYIATGPVYNWYII